MELVLNNEHKFQNCVILDSNKTYNIVKNKNERFQNCVILDSNKTSFNCSSCNELFQNCVILDSNKTSDDPDEMECVFQNCVILDSNKTYMLNWRNYSMEKSDKKIELTKQEKRSSLEAKFWNDKQKIDKNTSLMQKIEKICKDVDFRS